jgi:uncharacterized protein YkwD
VLAALAPAVLAAVLLAPSALPAAPKQAASMVSLEAGVLREVNATRAQYGLPPLRLNLRLSEAATAHTREMAADGYFKHNSFDGTPFWQRITHFYGVGGYGYWSVGENLLWSSPDVDASQALQWWMQSPPHRANILSKEWREVGIDALYVPGAPGTYHGLDVTLVTLDFGVRRPA